MVAELDDITDTDLGLPQVGAGVRFTTELVRMAAGPFAEAYAEFEELIGRHRDAMISIADGSDGVEFSVSLAGRCRREVEDVLAGQARLIRDMARDVRRQITAFETDAAAALTTSQTASHHVPDPDGVPRWMPDDLARYHARREHTRLTEQITSFGNTARMLDEGAERLDRAVITTGRTYDANADEIIATDARFAERMADVADEMFHQAVKFGQIADSICNTSGQVDLTGMIAAASLLPDNLRDELWDKTINWPTGSLFFNLAVQAEYERLRALSDAGDLEAIAALLAAGPDSFSPLAAAALINWIEGSTGEEVRIAFERTAAHGFPNHAGATSQWATALVLERLLGQLDGAGTFEEGSPERRALEERVRRAAEMVAIMDVIGFYGADGLNALDLSNPESIRFRGDDLGRDIRLARLLRTDGDDCSRWIGEIIQEPDWSPPVRPTGPVEGLSDVGDDMSRVGTLVTNMGLPKVGKALKIGGNTLKAVAYLGPHIGYNLRSFFGGIRHLDSNVIASPDTESTIGEHTPVAEALEFTLNAWEAGDGVVIQTLPSGNWLILTNPSGG